MPDLNPQQFFHGTRYPIKDGMVRPADDANKSVSESSMGDPGDLSEGDHAFAIRNDENYAWHAAKTFHNGRNRARVYEVDPAPDMKPGPWNKEHPDFLAHHELHTLEVGGETYHPDEESVKEALSQHQDEWASPTGFPVRKRIDIMPGRQGTFPDVNWNRFKNPNPTNVNAHRADANHPNDYEVQTPSQEWTTPGQDQMHQNALTARLRKAGNQRMGLRGDRTHVLPIVPGKRQATLFD